MGQYLAEITCPVRFESGFSFVKVSGSVQWKEIKTFVGDWKANFF